MNNIRFTLPKESSMNTVKRKESLEEENAFSFLERDAVRGTGEIELISLGYPKDMEIEWQKW